MYPQNRAASADTLERYAALLSTGVDPYTANLDRVYGQDPKRSPATTEPFPLEAQSVLPALQARRRDRPGRLQRDNDIVEQYCNPSKAFPSR
jgi:hypothetical protein